MVDVTVEQVAEEMFKLVQETFGKRSLTPGDLIKAMRVALNADKRTCKEAIRALVESGRCVYSCFGSSYITLPHVEGADTDKLREV